MTTFAVFMVGAWVGLAFGLALSGFGRMLRQPGMKRQAELESPNLGGHHRLVIAARGADRS